MQNRGSQRGGRLPWLTNSALVYEPKCQWGGGRGVPRSQPKSTAVQCAHGAQINFGDLAPYLTHGDLTYAADTCLCLTNR
jgi:hypothetical protein